MRKQTLFICSFSAIACCTAACSSLRVTLDANPKFTLASCQTYSWAGTFRSDRGPLPTFANPLNEDRLRTAIAANLQTKSVLQAADGASANCLVGYGIGVHRVIAGSYPYPYAWGGWGRRRGYMVGWGWDEPYVYHEGIIAVDIYDAKTRQPIWHASADQNVAGLTGAAAETKINAAVAAIFAKYPT